MEASTARFIAVVMALPAPTLAAVYEDWLDRWSQGGRDVSGAAGVSASENSAIRKAVRTALLQRDDTLDKEAGVSGDIMPLCAIAARVVCKRAKLTEEQYRLMLDPFTAAGVHVPARDA